MIRLEFVRRKLQLTAEDLERLAQFRDESLEAFNADDLKLAAVERFLERIVTRAIDVNQHLISELASGEDKASRLTYRDTFLMLVCRGIYSEAFAEEIARSAGLRNILVHDYNSVDRLKVPGSIKACLRDYLQYVEGLYHMPDKGENGPVIQ